MTGMELEDFALSGLDAQIEAITHHPGYSVLKERIRREGFEAGKAEAQARAAQERQALVEESVSGLAALLQELAAARARFQEQNFEEILQLALALARRVVRVESSENPRVLEESLRACLAQLEDQSSYQIRVHPDRIAAMQSLLAEKGDEFLGETPHKLVADRRVALGSLVLEGDGTRLESICKDALDRLEERLMMLHRDDEVRDAD